jgi:hypothetical protein
MLTDEQLQETIYDIFFHIKKNDPENKFSNWSAGITSNPDKRETRHKIKTNIKYFKSWDLSKKSIAKTVLNYLIENGFQNCKLELSLFNSIEGYFEDATFVYIYKNE